MQDQTPAHSKISPTAKMVAYWRQFSDVPFAQDVAQLMRADDVFQELLKDKTSSIENTAWLAPMIEARYKSMVRAIRKHKIKQVLELASGVSLRGLAMTADPEMTYVETDLPGMSQEKIELVQKIQKLRNIPERTNLFFYTVNILNLHELETAVEAFFDDEPIAIIHEGLFQYLSLEEKKTAAQNIRTLLKRFGGVWLTPDLNTRADLDMRWQKSESMQQLTENIKKATGRDFREAAFQDEAHLRTFFDELGFNIEAQPQIDSSYELTSARKLKLSKESIQDLEPQLKIWTLTLRPSS